MDIDSMIINFLSNLGTLNCFWMTNTLNQLKDIESKFSFLWNLEEAHRCLTPPSVTEPGKSEADAERIRTEGNILYRSNIYQAALGCYNLSILLAPHPELQICNSMQVLPNSDNNLVCKPKDSEKNLQKYRALSYGYANRSAVYLVLKEYDKCLLDIDLALRFGYPKLLRSKLEERKERCLKAKEQSPELNTPQTTRTDSYKCPSKLTAVNPSVPAFSNAVKLAYSSEKGRHVIATRDIQPGELIAVEKSYCSSVFAAGPYCLVCLKLSKTIIPCPSCCRVVFCSDACRAKGLNDHKKECQSLQALENLGELDENTALALQIVARATYAEVKKLFPVLKKERKELLPEKLGFNQAGKFISSDYRSVFHFIPSRSETCAHMTPRFCLLAFILTKILYQSRDFFISKEGVLFIPSKEDLILVGSALLHHLSARNTPFALRSTQVVPTGNGIDTSVTGRGIFPALSLVRHSCNAKTFFFNSGNTLILQAFLPISSGEEVTMALLGRFQTTPFMLRTLHFEQSGFKCSCEACKGSWPSIPEIPDTVLVKCIKCSSPVTNSATYPSCKKCNIIYSKSNAKGKNSPVKRWWSIVDRLTKQLKKFEQLYMNMEKGQPLSKQDFETLCRFSELIAKHVQQPSLLFHRVLEVFIYVNYKGNT